MGTQSQPKGSGPKTGHGLVFDVHGTPPYVSAESDEAGGFRISCNTSYTVTDFVPRANNSEGTGQAMPGLVHSPPIRTTLMARTLRLVRQGHRFACLFQLLALARGLPTVVKTGALASGPLMSPGLPVSPTL
jgi:hypothetical protein